MDLRERLSRLGYFRPAASTPDGPPSEGRDAEAPTASVAPLQPARPNGRVVEASSPAAPDVHHLIPGSRRQALGGDCFVAETSYPLEYVHAGAAVSDLLGIAGETFARLCGDARLADLDPERTVFLDTETTGLAGGTGTFVFLIGIGYFSAGEFRIDQFFMRDPGEERHMLGALADVLRRFDAVVSFNGKCFDWPLIENRHVYAGIPLHPVASRHVDLLYPARRLYKRRLGSCSLGSLECSVLGLAARQDDVPGWLIPTLYFEYLRSRDGRPLERVFMHNRRDILAMLALAIRMARHVADPVGAAPDDARDLFSLGRMLDDGGAVESAIHCYERALAMLASDAREPPPRSPSGYGTSSWWATNDNGTRLDREEVHARLGGAYKRIRDAERAVALWESLVAERAGSIYPYVELAKHLEHRERAYERAAALTREALSRHERIRADCPPGRYLAERVDLEKRLARLERRLASASSRVRRSA